MIAATEASPPLTSHNRDPIAQTSDLSFCAIPMDQITARDVDRWRDLARRVIEPNPFQEPDYVLPYVAQHPGGQPGHYSS